MNEGALVAETKALIAEVESGQTDRAAWVAIQDRVRRLAEGRSQAEVGKLIGKGSTWVSDVLAWSVLDQGHLPHGGPRQDIAQSKSRAKKALRDPEIRAVVLDALDDDDLLDVATEAAQMVSEKVQAEGKERKRDARANREERSTDPSGTHLKLVRLNLTKADDAIARAINTARDAGWSEGQTEQLLARIAKTEGLIAVLKLAVTNETDIDWDAALVKLVEEEQAA